MKETIENCKYFWCFRVLFDRQWLWVSQNYVFIRQNKVCTTLQIEFSLQFPSNYPNLGYEFKMVTGLHIFPDVGRIYSCQKWSFQTFNLRARKKIIEKILIFEKLPSIEKKCPRNCTPERIWFGV